MTDRNHFPNPVLGEASPRHDGETVIAWGYVDAEVDGVEYERWCLLTLLHPAFRVPNVKNYAVHYFYPGAVPPDTNRHEATETFPNIVPAVETYCAWGMDY